MELDFLGRIRKIVLPERSGLQAVFEAIINSVDSIEEVGAAEGYITVELTRDVAALHPDAHGNTIAALTTVTITDNGAGFTTKNFGAFQTVDTTYKASRGGKGVGRLLWLKAFEWAEIDSIYPEDGRWWHRHFEFRPTPTGIERHVLRQLDGAQERRTSVRLVGYREAYQAATAKSAPALARRIVEHCMEYFLLNRMPAVTLIDEAEAVRIDLHDLFKVQYQPQADRQDFVIQAVPFELRNVLLQKEGDLAHQLHFCAHNRVVRSIALAHRLDHLPPAIANPDGAPFVYHGYVSSPYLDERVDAERTGFALDRKGDLALQGGITWDDVVDAAVSAAEETLRPFTQETRQRALEKVTHFITEKAPKYRPLLHHRREAIERISGDLSDERLDLELYRVYSEWRGELRTRAQEQLQASETLDSDIAPAFRDRMAALLGEIDEAAKSELAEYVVQRRLVLEFLQKLLGLQDTGRFAHEDALHDLLFPRRTTSDEIDYDTHNLWLLDERLAYHLHLSSDKPLVTHGGPIQTSSSSRPDLLIYNRAMAFSDAESPISSAIIVEFKKPERDDYSDAENPIRQVMDYILELRAGRAQRPKGGTVELPPTVPFYCYIVATRTERLKREAELQDYMKTPDGLGYFKFHSNLNAYIEIVSYQKVLADAKKRNRAFFERLNLPIH